MGGRRKRRVPLQVASVAMVLLSVAVVAVTQPGRARSAAGRSVAAGAATSRLATVEPATFEPELMPAPWPDTDATATDGAVPSAAPPATATTLFRSAVTPGTGSGRPPGSSARRPLAAISRSPVTAARKAPPGVGGAPAPSTPSLIPRPSGPLAPPTCNGRASEAALSRTVICMAASPSGRGYWLVGADGGVFTYGDAGYFGSLAERRIDQAIVAMAVTPDAKGYWLVGANGGVSAFGDAVFRGAAVILRPAAPIVAAASTPSGAGYWLTGGDGAVYPFGDARSFGDLQTQRPPVAIVGLASAADGRGYWLAGADGGVYSFGSARFHGALPSRARAAPIVSISATRDGGGYWLAAADGGVFTFGNAPFHGSAASAHGGADVVSVAPIPDGSGYWLAGADGGVFTFGTAAFLGSAWTSNVAPIIAASAPSRGPVPVGIFYYPWYATYASDGALLHWGEGAHSPPDEIGSDYYPQRGVYSSTDDAVVDAQMLDIAQTGVDTVITSWWGRGSFEDARLVQVARATAAHQLRLAVQLEPYGDRSPDTVSDDLTYLQTFFGVTDVFVFDAEDFTAPDWSRITHDAKGMRIFATGGGPGMITGTFQGWAAQAGFAGIYTYTALFPPNQFPKVCQQARAQNLLCVPSVAPGYKATRATGDTRVVDRNNGGTYDAFWADALAAAPSAISITSYNEWHEGTQIEAAVPHCSVLGFCSSDYENAYGTSGGATSFSYLGRTKYWLDRLRKPGG